MAIAAASRDVTTKLRYFVRNPPPDILDENGAYLLDTSHLGQADGTSEQFKGARHKATEEFEVQIVDARAAPNGGMAAWNLDTHGFMCIRAPPPPADFNDRRGVRADYFPQLEERAREATGATHAFVTYFGMRTETPTKFSMSYARFGHTDAAPGMVQSWRRTLLKRGVPEEELITSEICSFNIWHPKDRPAYKDPLCLLDVSTRKQGKLPDGAPVGTVLWQSFGPKGMYNLGPLHGSTDRWVFCPDMKPDEAWLFKNYDTREDVARCTFHNSFHDPFHDPNPQTPGRRSCEFALLLTFPKKNPEAKL